jgi:hypothetical protein
LPTHDLIDGSGLDVVYEAGNHLSGFGVWLRDKELDVFAECTTVIIDWEEVEVGTSPSSELLVRRARVSAFGVLHDDHRVDAEHVTRERQAPKHIVGHSASGISDDVSLTQTQSERREHIDARVHARDDGESSARAWVGDVRTSGRISLVVGKQATQLSHHHVLFDRDGHKSLTRGQ